MNPIRQVKKLWVFCVAFYDSFAFFLLKRKAVMLYLLLAKILFYPLWRICILGQSENKSCYSFLPIHQAHFRLALHLAILWSGRVLLSELSKETRLKAKGSTLKPKTGKQIQWLSDNGSCATAKETVQFGQTLGVRYRNNTVSKQQNVWSVCKTFKSGLNVLFLEATPLLQQLVYLALLVLHNKKILHLLTKRLKKGLKTWVKEVPATNNCVDGWFKKACIFSLLQKFSAQQSYWLTF